MRKFGISALALFASIGLVSVASAQTIPSTSPGQVTIGTAGISGFQSQGTLNLNSSEGNPDMVGGAPLTESGRGTMYTTDTSTIGETTSGLTATTTGDTVGVQTSSISDPDETIGGTSATTINNVFGESETDSGFSDNVPSLTANDLGW